MTIRTSKFACTRLSIVVVFLSLTSLAAGQEVEPSQSSFEQLKTTGALKSNYRNRQFSSVDTKTPEPSLNVFRQEIAPLLAESCVDCHGADTQEGNIRIDTLDPDLFHGKDVDWWIEILAVLTNGEMPPPDEVDLADNDRSKIVQWLTTELQIASTVRRATQNHSSFRRMTRYEYNYTLQDLLGLPYDFAKALPPDAISEDGFENSSETLHMSSVQFAAYRESAHEALKRATVVGHRPKPMYWGISMATAANDTWKSQRREAEEIEKKRKDDPEKLKQELERHEKRVRETPRGSHYKELSTGRAGRIRWSYGGAKYAWDPTLTRSKVPIDFDTVAVLPPRQKMTIELGDQLPDHGNLRIRVRASRLLESERPPSLQLEFGWQASNDSSSTMKISKRDLLVDASPGKPEFYQFDIPIGEVYPRNTVRGLNKMGDLPSPSEFVKLVNSSVSEGTIQIDYVEVMTPVYAAWPPDSHDNLFIDSESKADEVLYAREILEHFMPRAWRRRTTSDEIQQKLEFFNRIRPQCDDFQDATLEVLATVLSSPKFLYVPAGSGQNELATRLSMFLWCSAPDQELTKLASLGRLNDPEVLGEQVDRMLADPRSHRFSKQFVRSWLGMQLLDFLQVDRKVYRGFDNELKEAMQHEPIELFHEVLQNDRTVLDFLHADYTIANERLAEHYELDEIHGNDLRRVKLDPRRGRGGLLTAAGLLAMNSDGKDSHPLKRGIWMLESLLNDPPPPPPPAVPEIDLADPEIAKLTLKERIEDHRNQAACMSCHAKIDPWGIAFENFDAVGRWRTKIRDKPVDATSDLFNGQKLDGMDGLKRFLLEHRQDQFVRATVHKMMTFALGRPLSFGDRSSIDQITADLRKQGDGLATMVELVVTSDLFRGL